MVDREQALTMHRIGTCRSLVETEVVFVTDAFQSDAMTLTVELRSRNCTPVLNVLAFSVNCLTRCGQVSEHPTHV
jgi:hypothetical protein